MEQREDVCVGRIITKGDVHDEGEERERERERERAEESSVPFLLLRTIYDRNK